jgi:hypothetical protein
VQLMRPRHIEEKQNDWSTSCEKKTYYLNSAAAPASEALNQGSFNNISLLQVCLYLAGNICHPIY